MGRPNHAKGPTTTKVLAAVLAAVLLTGCAGTQDTLAQAASGARAAVGGAILAIEVASGAPPGVLSTALDDASREVIDATTTVLELRPEDAAAERDRDRVLAALRDAQDAVLLARQNTEGARDALADARDALEAGGG